MPPWESETRGSLNPNEVEQVDDPVDHADDEPWGGGAGGGEGGEGATVGRR